eukprot:9447046-Alexandrium_andersonii.AAC.1
MGRLGRLCGPSTIRPPMDHCAQRQTGSTPLPSFGRRPTPKAYISKSSVQAPSGLSRRVVWCA